MFQMADTGAEQMSAGDKPAKGSVESLRRETLVLIARILIGASLAGVLPALWVFPSGQYIPFATAIAALGLGFVVAITADRPTAFAPMPVLLVGIAAIGATHSVLDPAFADFGLATAVLVPVLAALLGNHSARRLSWILMVGVVAVGVVARYMPGSMPQVQATGSLLASVLSYAVFALIVAIAALRLGALLERADKAETDSFRYLINNFRFVVFRLSPTGETVFVSRAAETLLGCKRFELGGDGLNERVHVQDRPIFLTALSEAANVGTPRTIEVRLRNDGDGTSALPSFVWVECGLSPVQTSSDVTGPFEVMLLARDISERVAQREEMNRARLVAQKASEAKSHFLATIGHELRTPLNAIVGFSDMMRSGLGNASLDAQREYADLIHQSGMHLLETVNMLLDMSKIEAGKFDLQIDEFAPETLLAPSIGMVEPMAREKRVGISVEIAPDMPRILGDERACRQIVINLLSNAVKFSHGNGEVRVNIGRRGRQIALTIADNGIGMTPEVVARLGEPFFQAHDGPSRKFEGTGLGLSIVKGLIELHEGRLEVQSRPDKGTTMTVLLPISGPITAPVPTEVVTRLPESRTDSAHKAMPARRRAAL